MAAKPIKQLEIHLLMIHFLIRSLNIILWQTVSFSYCEKQIHFVLKVIQCTDNVQSTSIMFNLVKWPIHQISFPEGSYSGIAMQYT